jgi:hypothetical protein
MCRKSRNPYFFLAGEFKAQNANKWDAAWSVSLWREGENWREWRMRIERERMSSSNFLFDRERRLERERRRKISYPTRPHHSPLLPSLSLPTAAKTSSSAVILTTPYHYFQHSRHHHHRRKKEQQSKTHRLLREIIVCLDNLLVKSK